jgi:hypothetical protein
MQTVGTATVTTRTVAVIAILAIANVTISTRGTARYGTKIAAIRRTTANKPRFARPAIRKTFSLRARHRAIATVGRSGNLRRSHADPSKIAILPSINLTITTCPAFVHRINRFP